MILDATVAPQVIRYPTDLSLLNEAREFSERIIDELHPKTDGKKKPRTYREKARKAFLAVVKQKRPTGKVRRRGIKQQLQYPRRNLGHIEHLLEYRPEVYVRPIIRGKLDKPVEFGAKLSVSLNGDGVACVDHLRWDAFHEGGDLKSQVEVYRERQGCYPEVVLGDPAYGTRDNRKYLKGHGIRFAGKPLGRPRKVTEENKEALKRLKAQRREDYLQRIPIEGKFGQGKNGYNLNYIRAKRADTSAAWINSIFLVMNLLILLRIFFALWKGGVATAVWSLLPVGQMLLRQRDTRRVINGAPEQSSAITC